jgi:hypothetical protein
MPRRTRLVLGAASVLIAGLSLTACGGGAKSGSSTPSASSSSSPSSTAARQGGAAGLFGSTEVQQCLKAAGITIPTPTGSRPNRPSGSFTPGTPGAQPSGGPTGSFTRGAGGFGGGFFGADPAQAQAIQAALKACGITLPTGGRRPGSSSAGAPPTATPTPSI